MTKWRTITAWILRVALVVGAIYDVIMAANGTPGDTFSELIQPYLLEHPWAFAFALITVGHLVWPQFRNRCPRKDCAICHPKS